MFSCFGPKKPCKKNNKILTINNVYKILPPNITERILKEQRKKEILKNLIERQKTINDNVDKFIKTKNPKNLEKYSVGNLVAYAHRGNWLNEHNTYVMKNGIFFNFARGKPLTKNMMLENIILKVPTNNRR